MEKLNLKSGDCIKYIPKPDKPDKFELGRVEETHPKRVTVRILKDPKEITTLKNRCFWPNELVQTTSKATVLSINVPSRVTVLYASEFVRKYYDKNAQQFNRELIKQNSEYLLRCVNQFCAKRE